MLVVQTLDDAGRLESRSCLFETGEYACGCMPHPAGCSANKRLHGHDAAGKTAAFPYSTLCHLKSLPTNWDSHMSAETLATDRTMFGIDGGFSQMTYSRQMPILQESPGIHTSSSWAPEFYVICTYWEKVFLRPSYPQKTSGTGAKQFRCGDGRGWPTTPRMCRRLCQVQLPFVHPMRWRHVD